MMAKNLAETQTMYFYMKSTIHTWLLVEQIIISVFFRKSQSQLTSKGSYKEIEGQKGILMPTDWKNLFFCLVCSVIIKPFHLILLACSAQGLIKWRMSVCACVQFLGFEFSFTSCLGFGWIGWELGKQGSFQRGKRRQFLPS
jgi:hypothetical protein